ncbi:PAS domain-containing response regulator [Halorarius litoreus]|uniref:PAS domain-containing response regulator n=1 Tax=Halorarius litoreus TaxID=2962676 RepID=UPI0020CCB1EE|nr:PAS domain S-box protein [Halorarius litoreus]
MSTSVLPPGPAVAEAVHVLHVEDDADFGVLTRAALTAEGFHVETATDSDAGLAYLDDHPVDCVVSDYNMPDRNGLELLGIVRDRYGDLPFILFTGRGSEEIASDAISSGVTDYLQKGRGSEQYQLLANRIQNAVERHRVDARNRRWWQAIETAQEGIAIVDAAGHYTDANSSYAELYGYDREAFVGRHWRELYPDDQVAYLLDEVIPEMEATGSWVGEAVAQRRSGEQFVESLSMGLIHDGGHVCVATDLTRHQEVRESLDRYRQAIALLPDPVCVLDEDLRFDLVSEGFAELVGVETLVNQPLSVVFDEPSVEQARTARDHLRTGTTHEVMLDVTLQPNEGETIESAIQFRGLFDDGELRGLVGTVTRVVA